jgi:hypothetical protein
MFANFFPKRDPHPVQPTSLEGPAGTEIADSMMVDCKDKEQISKFVDMSSKHINQMVAEGHGLEKILACVKIITPNKALEASVARSVRTLAVVALLARKLGRPIAMSDCPNLMDLSLDEGMNYFENMLRDLEEEDE